MIQEPTKFSPNFYSHKLKHAGVRYEVCISLKGSIVWVNGPFPAGSHSDLRVFRSSLKEKLNYGERILADRGYGDEKCVTPRKISNRAESKAASRFRANHERINGRFKRFSVLSSRFRHNLDKHAVCFHTIANIIQIEIELYGQ